MLRRHPLIYGCFWFCVLHFRWRLLRNPTSREANFIAAKFFLWRDVFIWWSFHWQFPLHRIDTLLYFLCYPQVPLVRTKVNYCNFLVKILSFLSCLILIVVPLKTTTNTQLWIFNDYKIAILAEARANYYHPNQVYSHKSSMAASIRRRL